MPRGVIYDDGLVLPHEKLYLEHIPAADRYFKSFMHRDAVNFNIITKWVFSVVCDFPAHPKVIELTTWCPLQSTVTSNSGRNRSRASNS